MSAAQLTQQICCGLLTPAASVEVGKLNYKPFSLWLPDARACENRRSEGKKLPIFSVFAVS